MLTVAKLITVLLLTVSPRQSFAPTTITIRLQVEPQAENRLVRVTLVSEDFGTATDIPLEGERSAKTQAPITYKSVPAGDYEVIAQLFDSAAKVIATAKSTVHVEGFE